MSNPHDERPLTVAELAEYWKCSEQHVRNQVARGMLKAIRIGKLIRIPIAAIEEFEAAMMTAPAADPEPADEAPPEAAGEPRYIQVPSGRWIRWGSTTPKKG
jgi:excisionase family DNA binding protein